MKVLLVGPDLEYNLSLGYLASSLKNSGHKAELAAFNDMNDIQSVSKMAAEFDMVGLSLCFQIRLSEFTELAHTLKERYPKLPIVAGGHFASCAARQILTEYADIDIIVLHEGEHTIVELANFEGDLLNRAHQVPGIVCRLNGQIYQSVVRESISDLNALPFPDRSGTARLMVGVPTTFMMGSRGCYKNCDYCCISTLHKLAPGKKFRQRTVKNIVEEMNSLYHQKGIRQFVFHDDNFLVPSLKQNLERIDELDAELKKHNISDIGLVLKCSPSDAHPQVLAKLKKMGLIRIFMGIESGSAEGLSSLGRKQSIADAKMALELCRNLGISAQYTVIIFNPDATLQTMQADLDFVNQFPNNPINYCRAEVYAGTPLENRLLGQSRLSGDYKRYKYNYKDEKVQKVWEIAYDLFMGRCWGENDLLSNMIHIDHQVIALKHFYEGVEPEQTYHSFALFQKEVNLKTKEIFSELLSIVSEYFNQEELLEQKIKELRVKEYEQRMELELISCRFKSQLDSYTYDIVEYTDHKLKLEPTFWYKGMIPRHAAAVLLALGLSSCLIQNHKHFHGVAEAPPPPDWYYESKDTNKIKPEPKDTIKIEKKQKPDTIPVKIDEYDYKNFHGVAEAAPPPDWYYKNLNPPLNYEIEISSKNTLDVYIDGFFYGSTPLKTSIASGKHELRLENKKKKINVKKVIDVKKEGDNNFIYKL